MLSNMNPEEIDDPTQRRYTLRCALRFYNTTIREQVGGKDLQYSRKLAFLLPQESDERSRFLSAWLPDQIDEHFEIAGFIRPPIDSPVRLSVFRGPDKRCERHYLMVMSKGVEDILVRLREGSEILLTTFAAHEESEADHARDTSDGNYDLIPGHTELQR